MRSPAPTQGRGWIAPEKAVVPRPPDGSKLASLNNLTGRSPVQEICRGVHWESLSLPDYGWVGFIKPKRGRPHFGFSLSNDEMRMPPTTAQGKHTNASPRPGWIALPRAATVASRAAISLQKAGWNPSPNCRNVIAQPRSRNKWQLISILDSIQAGIQALQPWRSRGCRSL